jgi:PHD/YefM family antitoxin component YafN of YafNO toxin-antitoxin module
MPTVNEGYIVDEGGNRVGVIVPMEDYLRLMEELEELESIRAYDAAKQSGDEAVPFDQAVREIEQDRQ